MSARRINWSAIGTFLFVLFVLGVLAFEQTETNSEHSGESQQTATRIAIEDSQKTAVQQ